MDFKELSNLIKSTRSVRRFKSGVSIDKLELKEIVDVARITSSALNKQPLKYIIISNINVVKQLSENAKWAAHLTDWEQSGSEQPSAFIIVLNDTQIDGYELIDTGIVLQTMMLLINSKGYSGCALASVDKDQCKDLFELDENIVPILAIAIGVSDESVESVQIVENDTNYYRDGKDNHCVPKRSLSEVLIGSY